MGLFSKTTASGIEYLIVGLGNPDKKYENTRHNAGFMALDKIAEDCGASVDRVKFKALTGKTEIGRKGNPDKKYENTRHNAGFMALDKIAEDCGASVDRVKFKALTGKTEIGRKKCLLMKPLTYMNLSGESVAAAMRFYKVPLERVVVFYDDISLEPSFLRIRRKGSDGGHNGIKNIILMAGGDTFPRVKIGVGKKPHPDYDLADWVLSSRKGSDGGHNGIKNIILMAGGDTFPRVKIGVGKKPHPDYDLADWVLSSFSQKEKKELSQALEHCPDIAALIVNGQIDKAMNQYNS